MNRAQFCNFLSVFLFLLSCISCTVFPQNTFGGSKHFERTALKKDVLLQPQELQVFLNNIFTQTMKEFHVPGAVFVLVKDRDIFFIKGYGFADIEKQRPVNPYETLFRIASVSKLFTATAVMQLYERGLLDLYEDVNSYLIHFKLPETYDKPVTLANLLTHTAGFDKTRIGLAVRRPEEILPLGSFLAKNLPPRLIPPGEIYNYSRHGVALAGYVVETISGIPFDRYMDRHIFNPLGMSKSSFGFPSQRNSNLASGYVFEHGKYRAVDVQYFHTVPEVSLVTTASDMARFMIMHLHKGTYKGIQILEESTAEEMHRQQFTYHPKLAGTAYGFYERIQNGIRGLQHGGRIKGYSSRLVLLPDQDLGFFIACNTSEFKLISEVTNQFFDHYYPITKRANRHQPQDTFLNQSNRYTGWYLSEEHSRRSIERVFAIFRQIHITADNDDILKTGGKKWIAVNPLLFESVDGEEFSAFREDEYGKVTHWFRRRNAYKKLESYESRPFQLILFAGFVFVFFTGFFLWPLRDLDVVKYVFPKFDLGKRLGNSGMRQIHGSTPRTMKETFASSERSRNLPSKRNPGGEPGNKHMKIEHGARMIAALVGILNLAFIFGILIALINKPDALVYGVPGLLMVLLCLPIMSTVLTSVLLVMTFVCWQKGFWSLLTRIHYTLFVLAAVGFIPFLNYWNLLGFRF